ncbi:hypothetical protein T4D_2394 [Trichinella pseudospiralis]|uniref:Uncharacterized protein n=2 Tax=Trichinella pseudospiralis TaxID=6337 RepID=A0A0V1F4W8_TRIPS|nr:hypothetical protein T4D_2394 [Trichinella pseudospiralis]
MTHRIPQQTKARALFLHFTIRSCIVCCEHSSLPLVLNLLFVGAVGSVSVTSTKSNKVCRLGADVPVWMLSAIVKIHVIWLLYKPLSHESYGKASIRMPEERPWAAMMTSQYAASYQVVTIPREDVCAYI